MAEAEMTVLLDENIPSSICAWLREQRPCWRIEHAVDAGLKGKPDSVLYTWAIEHRAVIVTFDEDFADARTYPLGTHYGVVRLRVWPTTVESTRLALERLLREASDDDWRGNLIIVDNQKTRLRRLR